MLSLLRRTSYPAWYTINFSFFLHEIFPDSSLIQEPSLLCASMALCKYTYYCTNCLLNIYIWHSFTEQTVLNAFNVPGVVQGTRVTADTQIITIPSLGNLDSNNMFLKEQERILFNGSHSTYHSICYLVDIQIFVEQTNEWVNVHEYRT